MHRVLSTPGVPLPTASARPFVPMLGHRLTDVRIHDDPAAARSAELVGARAYTVGSHIVFASGQFQPASPSGRRLLAHELTHVAQQAGSEPGTRLPLSAPDEAAELEAERVADAALSGGSATQRVSATGARVSRQVWGGVKERAFGALISDLANRQSIWSTIKEAAYGVLIGGLRLVKQAHLKALRALVNALPPAIRPYGTAFVDIVEAIDDILIGIVLAVVGIVVGFGEGAVGLVRGLVTLVTGVAEGLYAAALTVLTGNTDRLAQWWEGLLDTLRAIPSRLQALVTEWLAEFRAAPIERQQIMIGELTGQLLTIIASFYVAPSRTGSVGGLSEASAATSRAGLSVGRPGLTVIEGGGGGSARLAAGGTVRAAATEGNAARQLSYLADVAEAAPRTAPVLVPPPPAVAPAPTVATPSAAGRLGTARRIAAGVATAVRSAQRNDDEPDERAPTMRHQIQRGDDKHYCSRSVTASDVRLGVVGRELRGAMSENFHQYMRIAHGHERPPRGWVRGPVEWEPALVGAIARQSRLITQIIEGGGVDGAGDVNALRTCFHPQTLNPTNCDTNDVRLDVENQGHNLRA